MTLATVHLTAGKAWLQAAFPQGAYSGANPLGLGSLPSQSVVTARWPDQSVKLARVACDVPQDGDYTLTAVQSSPSLPDVPRSIPLLSLWADFDGELWHAIPEPQHAVDDWEVGPLHRETRYRVPYRKYVEGVPYTQHQPHPFLKAVVDVRVHADGSWWASVAAENVEDSPAAGPVHYDLLRLYDGDDGERLRPENYHEGVTHPYKDRCRLYATSYNFTRSRVTPDVGQFVAAGFLPTYNPNITGSDGTGYAPFSPGMHEPLEQLSGGRDELAPWPGYVARALARPGDQDQWDAVREHADLAGGRPVHVREADGSWAVFGNHVADQLGAGWPSGTPGGTNWNPDVAHQPSFAYWAWLATGERYYAEELSVNAQSTALLTYEPARDYLGQPAPMLHAFGEMRSWWGVLRMAEAAFALPDGWPGVSDLLLGVRANCAYLDWVSGPPGYSPLGVGPHFWRPQWTDPGYETFAPVAPWEVQYAFISVCWARKWLGVTEGAAFVQAFGATLAAVGNDPQFRSQGGFPYIWVVGGRPFGGPPNSVTFYQTVAAAYPGPFDPFEGPGYRLALQLAVGEGVNGAASALAWLNTQSYVTFDRLQRPGWDYSL